ncbi:hypothetical protein AB6C53_03175 [Vibrio splendidus]
MRNSSTIILISLVVLLFGNAALAAEIGNGSNIELNVENNSESNTALETSNKLLTQGNVTEQADLTHNESVFEIGYQPQLMQQGKESVTQVLDSDIAQTEKSTVAGLLKQQTKLISDLQKQQLDSAQQIIALSSSKDDMSYAFWVSILLACVTIIVTVLGVVIAIISFFGFNHVKQSAKDAAEKLSRSVASEVAKEESNKKINEVAKTEIARLLDGGELQEHLESAVDLIVRDKQTSSETSGFNKYPELDLEDDVE